MKQLLPPGAARLEQMMIEAPDIATLVRSAGEARALAIDLHAADAGAAWITRMVTVLNDRLTQRVLELIAPHHRLPAARWCWLGLGSEGRQEQTLDTDQDNGLVFSAVDHGEAQQLRELFLPFAREANARLAECGFPLCDGEVMAGNPRWCLSSAEWRQNFSSWIRTPEPDALLNATIFFDFRPLAGDASLATELRQFLTPLATGNGIFLRMMVVNALTAAPPLGRLRTFALDAEGQIDLKKSGSRLFVDAARILALATGVDATATADRLRQIAQRSQMNAATAESAVRAFHALQGLRLAAQIDGRGNRRGNRLDPEHLNDFDRQILIETLRQARNLQLEIKTRFQIDA